MKEIITFITALTLICTLTACSSTAAGDNGSAKDRAIVIVDSSVPDYTRTELPQPENIGVLRDIRYNEPTDQVYILGSSGVCITDSTFGSYSCISYGETDVVLSDINGDRLYILTHLDDMKYMLSIYSLNGDMISSRQVNLTHLTEGVPNRLFSMNDGSVLMFDGTNLISLTPDGSGSSQQNGGSEIFDIFRGTDGKLYCLLSNKTEKHIARFDTEFMFESEERISVPDSLNRRFIQGFGDYLFCCSGSSELYGVTSDNKAVKLLDMAGSGLLSINNITPIGNGFIGIENGKLVRISEHDNPIFGEKQELVLAVTNQYDPVMLSVSLFNSASNKYKVTVKDYSLSYDQSLDGFDSATKDLELDIIAGRVPDIVLLDYSETRKLASKGAFADLYQFMDTDPTYTRDKFLPNYLDVLETDDKLFNFAPSFIVRTLAAKESRGLPENWTPEQFLAAYEAVRGDTQLLDIACNKESVLWAITSDGYDYVDYDHFTCSFDSPEYISMLKFADQFPSVRDCDFEKRTCLDDTALLSLVYCQSFREFNTIMQTSIGEAIAFPGFPTSDGSGSEFILGKQYAILADSPNKEGAWEFLRSQLTHSDCIPALLSSLELDMEKAQEIPRAENGEPMPEIGYTSSGEGIQITPMSAEDAKRYYDFLRTIKRGTVQSSETAISSIIHEETIAFFAGACTADRCAELIQNRISLYLGEIS